MESSVTGGGSLASATACIRNIARRAMQILLIIFFGHCTPVQRIEEGAVLAPARLHADMQVQIDLQAEQAFHFLARQRADLFEHGAAGSDHNRLLSVPLQMD